MDTVTAEVRSRNMARIRSKNTAPELELRRALYSRGLRYRIHVRKLPGSPDVVLTKWKTVVFMHGCFWHGHTCKYSRLPKSNQEYWSSKISRNAEKDQQHLVALEAQGWRVLTVWECSLKGATPEQKAEFFDRLTTEIKNMPALAKAEATTASSAGKRPRKVSSPSPTWIT